MTTKKEKTKTRKRNENLVGETWSTIPNFSKYEASIYGRVRNKRTGYILTNRINSGIDYFEVMLINDNGEKKNMRLHTLIASAQCAPFYGVEVNHIDGNQLNNNAINLEWSTRKKNMKHASENGLLKGKRIRRKIKVYNVATWEYVDTFDNLAKASESLNISIAQLLRCCKRKHKTILNGSMISRYEGDFLKDQICTHCKTLNEKPNVIKGARKNIKCSHCGGTFKLDA